MVDHPELYSPDSSSIEHNFARRSTRLRKWSFVASAGRRSYYITGTRLPQHAAETIPRSRSCMGLPRGKPDHFGLDQLLEILPTHSNQFPMGSGIERNFLVPGKALVSKHGDAVKISKRRHRTCFAFRKSILELFLDRKSTRLNSSHRCISYA